MSALTTLPKAELHLHIEGTFEPELVFALAERNGLTLPFATVDDLRAAYRFDDLQSFLNLYYDCMAVLLTAEDFYDLAVAYLDRAAAQGVRHVELFCDPQAHSVRGVGLDTVLDGLTRALRYAEEKHGITGGIIVCFLRDQPVESAHALLAEVAGRLDDVIGVGLDSAEVGYPPSLFTEVYAEARRLGLHVVAHAGEEGPAEYVWEALDLLKAERIDHGVRSLEDDALIERLRAEQVPLTVCPLSNLKLRVVDDLADHIILDMLDHGLVATVNSDDPSYFGGYVGDNFEALAEAVGLNLAQAETLARNSVAASFASDDRKLELLAEIDEWVHSLA